LTVEQLNQLLKEKLLPDLKSQPSSGRMLEILRQAHRFNIIRLEVAQPFEQSRLEVLKTLPRVIQFNEITEWVRTAELHKHPEGAVAVEEVDGSETEGTEP
jgi:GTPase SAR1 family protein